MRGFILIIFLLSSSSIFSQNIVTDTIFHNVERKETLFSISQKYKITINDLLSFNPELRESRLRRRSTILVPVFKSPEDLNLKDAENELIETELSSLDSIYIQKMKIKTIYQFLTLAFQNSHFLNYLEIIIFTA